MSLREILIKALGGEPPKPEPEEDSEKCPKCGHRPIINVTCVDDSEQKRLCGECGQRWRLTDALG